MQDRHTYEYAVLRVVPRVEREEFLNVGVIVFCKQKRFIKVRYIVNEQKLALFDKELDIPQVKLNLESFEKIARGDKNGGPIAQMEVPERFRWLTAVRSSVIQTSRPHPGLCTDPDSVAEKLFTELVL